MAVILGEILKEFEILPKEAKARQEAGAKIIDCREDYEYEESHIPGSIHIPVDEISEENLGEAGVKKADEIIMQCRSGGRSERAYHELAELGYSNVKNLKGGIIRWRKSALPVEGKGECEGGSCKI